MTSIGLQARNASWKFRNYTEAEKKKESEKYYATLYYPSHIFFSRFDGVNNN